MGKLYIVATPIGNLEDLSLRALRILKEADLILCEDTRITKRLLEHYDIGTKTMSYHQHSTDIEIKNISELIASNEATALVTDAGTPGISDPGGKLIEHLKNNENIKIEAIPGPSALTAAISISGMPMEKFIFLGFLPHKKGRQTLIKKITESEYPVVLYESVHRINKLLDELMIMDKGLNIVICRELTKKFETVYRGNVVEVKNQLKENEVKGEFVVIINKY